MFSKHLPEELRIQFIDKQLTGETDTDSQSPPQLLMSDTKTLMPYGESRDMAIELFEKNYLEQLMHTSDGKIKRALEIAQLGRTRLYTLLKKHHITR